MDLRRRKGSGGVGGVGGGSDGLEGCGGGEVCWGGVYEGNEGMRERREGMGYWGRREGYL